jgi:hypothetical protein
MTTFVPKLSLMKNWIKTGCPFHSARRKSILFFGAVFCSILVGAQDEGAVVKRERIQRDKGIFFGGGVSIVGGSNFGDYSTGINFEGGYVKRLNRVLSIGGSFSYLSFKYDPSILQKPPAQNEDPVNFYYGYDINSNEIGSLLYLSGGDISMYSMAFNVKLNLVPVKDNSVISVYGFAKPFLTMASHGEVSGYTDNYVRDATTGAWNYVNTTRGSYSSESKISGGILLGPGIELFPGKKVSFFAQASFGYTFPVTVVSTRSYGNAIEVLSDPKFPVKDLGFTSINFAGGLSFNLD